MPLNKLDEILKLLEACDQSELGELRKMMDSAGSLMQLLHIETGSTEARNMRGENRIPYDSSAVVTRLTGVRPNEKTVFGAELKDVSRSGLCLVVEGRFIPSRLIKVDFVTPVGKNKEVVLEVVRVKDKHCRQSDSLQTEVGCKSIDYKSANSIIIRDRKVVQVRERLQKHEKVLVLVVGDHFSGVDQEIYANLHKAGYNVRKSFSVHQALASASKTQAQLMILCNGSKLKYDDDFIKGFRYRPDMLATIAIVDNESDRRNLHRAGIDECMTRDTIVGYLYDVVDAAIVGHELRHEAAIDRKRVLLVGGDNLTRNSIKDIFSIYRYEYVYCADSDGSEKYSIDDFEIVFAYYDSEAPLEFMRVLELYYSNTVIAICDSPVDGRDAIVRGAADYICTPIDKDAVSSVLTKEGREIRV